MRDSLVIIPTYNEKENIEKMIDTVLDLSALFDILVVDDGSPDGTGALVKGKIEEGSGRVHILERAGKEGLGKAYIAGFRWALERSEYKYIYEMDADFSHNPSDLLRLRQACIDGADVAIGSRYIKGGHVENWPLFRLAISYGASLYVRSILWIKVKDSTAGFKCFKREVLETIDLEKIVFVGYAFQIAMKYAALKKGFKLAEVPITFKDREEGTSKMSTAILNEAISGVWQMRFSKDL